MTVLTLVAVLAVLAHVQMAVLASLAQGAPATTTIAAVTGQMGLQGDTKLPPLTDRGWGLPVFVSTLSEPCEPAVSHGSGEGEYIQYIESLRVESLATTSQQRIKHFKHKLRSSHIRMVQNSIF